MSGTWRRRYAAILALLGALTLPVQAATGAEVPFKGSDRGSFFVTADVCAPGFVALDIDGNGRATQVGTYAIHADECFDGVSAFYGRLRITAANGDLIFATYSGTVPPDLSGYAETAVVTGGTGRFAGIAGELDITGVITGPDSYTQTVSGFLSTSG
jgi:hypothetical protein